MMMVMNAILTILLIVNIILGINDYKKNTYTKTTAFTWFIIGWLAFHVLVMIPFQQALL